jgi:putative flippase GtrA
MPEQTFRYAACGGANTLLGLVLFKLLLEFVFTGPVVELGFYAVKSHNAALVITSFTNFIVGFTLMKYVVFVDSHLKGRIQLFRYGLGYMFNLSLNYIMLKIFVEIIGWKPFISQVITTAFIIALSYFTQKYFSFRSKQNNG